jgi:radical SAM superfamily enzyme YgiQ (UPF0313 family)
MRKSVYIIAKVSGLPESEVFQKYEYAKIEMKIKGLFPIAPTDYVMPGTDWHEAMKICIPLLCRSDFYTMVDEPHTTAGGLLEHLIATSLKIPQIPFKQ